jgi:hypothetical protein
MKVLLVYPEFPDTYWGFRHALKFEGKRSPFPPLGLLTALPDTQLWRRLKKEGRLLKESSGNNTEGSLNFIPRMSAARLVEGYKKIQRTTSENSRRHVSSRPDRVRRHSGIVGRCAARVHEVERECRSPLQPCRPMAHPTQQLLLLLRVYGEAPTPRKR